MQKCWRFPFAFSSNGDGFIFHNKFVTAGNVEIFLPLNEFPSPEKLWAMYKAGRNVTDEQQKIIDAPYFLENPDKFPRYYQINAINKTVDAVTKGQRRILLVMATGTGKTFTALQIIWRLWKARIKKRILFLADRKNLISQTFTNDFAPFKESMTWVKKSNFDTAHEIYLALYQGLSGEEDTSLFQQFSPQFFDLIIVDECHRGSAKADSEWRKILEYFSKATQIGMTATPKEDNAVSNIDYFGAPVYTYSLKQGIEDGFLAPYRVVRNFFDKDIEGFIPYNGQLDDNGEVIDYRLYNTLDFDKTLILKRRTKLVAETVSDYLKKNNYRMDKTIFFCVDQEHAARMREALVNENADLCAIDDRYVMRITSDDDAGVKQLDNFRDVESQYPVLVTTSKLLTTGVDIPTVKNIVLDSNIRSMIEFKQIIGRGTRLREDLGKMYFTIFDFRNVTALFHDEKFDGPIEQDENFNPSNGAEIPPPPPTPPTLPRKKFLLADESVAVAQKQIQYLDERGKLVTENFIDYTRRKIKNSYSTAEDFLTAWNSAERKKIIIDELEAQAISFDELGAIIGKDLDPFDLILHLVYDKMPLTRREHAAILQSIEKLMGTVIKIDNSNANKEFGYNDGKAEIITDTILPCHFVTSLINGQPAEDTIFFDRQSPIFTAADQRNQIIRYDTELLDVPNQNNTPLVITFKNYVILRIMEIKLHKMTPTITLEDIFQKARITNKPNYLKQRAREYLEEFLKHLQTKGVIKSFEWSKKRNKFYGVRTLTFKKSKYTSKNA